MPPGRSKKTSCLEVGLTLALPLANRKYAPEDATTIIFHHPISDWGFILEEKCKNHCFDDIMKQSLELVENPKNWLAIGPAPAYWAGEKLLNQKTLDVFINVTNSPPTRPTPFDATLDKNAIRSLPYVKKHIFPESR